VVVVVDEVVVVAIVATVGGAPGGFVGNGATVAAAGTVELGDDELVQLAMVSTQTNSAVALTTKAEYLIVLQVVLPALRPATQTLCSIHLQQDP
jgi:hypothetical protein